jgi:hypothetical protein
MAENKSWHLIRTSLAIGVALCCALARGDAITPEARENRRQEIARKSEAERARLQRNFKAFRDLPQAEQDWLRQFTRELKADDRGEGKLRRVMHEYHDWLLTLTPGQAEDLRREPDPHRRDRSVRELLKKQQEQADATGAQTGVKTPRGLNSDDLDAVLAVVEKTIRNYLSPEEMEHLKKRHGVARHIYVLDLAFQQRAGTGPLGMPQWLAKKEVVESMVDAVAQPGLKHQLQTNIDRGARMMLIRWMVLGVRAEYQAEHEKIKPAQDALEKFFVQLKPSEQDEIMRLPFDQQPQKLMDSYLNKKSIEDPDNFPKPPEFPWFDRLNKNFQAQQRAAARAAEATGTGEADAANKEAKGKKNNKEKAKLKANK